MGCEPHNESLTGYPLREGCCETMNQRGRTIKMKCFQMLTVAVFACALGAEVIHAQDSAESERQPIVVRECRIEVIDRATLACEQVGVLGIELPQPGTTVTEGSVVARLKDDIPRAALAVARARASNDAAVRSAAKAAEVADKEVERAREANQGGRTVVSALEVDRLRLTAEQSDIETEQAQNELDLNVLRESEAQALLSSYQILAPFDGVVTRAYRTRGEAVRQGDPILEVVSTKRVRIEAELPLEYRSQVRQGASVVVIPESTVGTGLSADQIENLPGKITFVDPVVERLSETVRVHAEIDNPDGVLIPGLLARMAIAPRGGEKTVKKDSARPDGRVRLTPLELTN